MQGGSRIVLDANGPVRVDKAFVLDAGGRPAGAAGARSRGDRPRELHAHHLAGEPRAAAPAPSKPSEPAPEAERRSAAADRDRSRPRRHRHRHQGRERRDGKGRRAGIRARRCATSSRRSGKYRVAMTRSDDTFVPLAERVRFARAQGAALFVSIHADALPRNEGHARRRDRLHAVGKRLRRRGRAARRSREQGRRDRRRRSHRRAGRRRRYPDRPGAARDQDLFDPIRAHGGRRAQDRGAAAQTSAEVGGVQGADGAGRALGAGRAWLCVDQGGPQAVDLGGLAAQDRGGAGAGGRYVLYAAAGRLEPGRELANDRADMHRPKFQHKTGAVPVALAKDRSWRRVAIDEPGSRRGHVGT